MSTFYLTNNALNYTPVNNVFIEKYMPKARGEFIKVYLIMLKYTVSGEPGVSSSICASALNLLESDVMNALNYWHDEGVIKLIKRDKMNNFSVEFLPLDAETKTTSKDVNLLHALNNTQTSDMLNDIEKILARPLSSKEMEIYLSWQSDFKFSSELILLLIEYCVSKNKTDFRYIEKVAIAWNDKNIKTIDQAQNYIRSTEDKWIKIRKVMTYLGLQNGEVMKAQQELMEKWLFTFNFDLEVIEKACEVCSLRLNRADFKYIDGILVNWHKNNLMTLEDIAKKDNNTTKNNFTQQNQKFNNKPAYPNVSKGSKLKFNNFTPREYDYDELERKLLGWDKDD
ncbi:MAG: DnaD domain protein [Clostridium sp.]